MSFPPLHPIYHDYTHVLAAAFAHHDLDVRDTLLEIRETVLVHGDAGVRRLTCQYDRVRDAHFPLWVTASEIADAYVHVAPEFLIALRTAIGNVKAYHRHQLPQNWNVSPDVGISYGASFHPMDRVALYVPGGRALYPSSVIMNAIPAQIAGVPEAIVTTPPQPDGTVAPEILVAAAECGISRVLRVGGAQAIFALAYGTDEIPVVDKIVGPGNKYVDGAKQLVYGRVAIDKPAGPSEVLVYVDKDDWIDFAASEILSQLEHDPDASAVALAPTEAMLQRLQTVVLAMAAERARVDILKESLRNFYSVVVADSGDTMLLRALNGLAGEHVVLLTERAATLLPGIRHAGSVFLGPYTPVALGDYAAGPNHVLPTARAARFSSPLGVMDFMTYTAHLSYDKNALKKIAGAVMTLANTEGFEAHAHSVALRLRDDQ